MQSFYYTFGLHISLCSYSSREIPSKHNDNSTAFADRECETVVDLYFVFCHFCIQTLSRCTLIIYSVCICKHIQKLLSSSDCMLPVQQTPKFTCTFFSSQQAVGNLRHQFLLHRLQNTFLTPCMTHSPPLQARKMPGIQEVERLSQSKLSTKGSCQKHLPSAFLHKHG